MSRKMLGIDCYLLIDQVLEPAFLGPRRRSPDRNETSCLRVVLHPSERAIYQPLHNFINHVERHQEPLTGLHWFAKAVVDADRKLSHFLV